LGQDVTAFSPRALSRLGVGRTFQITATFASMSVRENVQMALIARHRQVWRFGRAADRRFGDAAMALLDQVGLAGLAPGPAGTLAYGDLKRLELAMALACDPMLLLMDEPTAGMAASERSALMALVRSLASARRLAVLFTEHDMDVVFTCADRILVLDHGTLIAAGDAAAIQADGRVRDIYLGAL
jgi:branched-chain amino acid transport system ATP-binding protein